MLDGRAVLAAGGEAARHGVDVDEAGTAGDSHLGQVAQGGMSGGFHQDASTADIMTAGDAVLVPHRH
jgi:hypothetical protein